MDTELEETREEGGGGEREKKDRARFPQSKRGNDNIHSRVTVTTTHHPQHDTLGRTTNQSKQVPKSVKNKGVGVVGFFFVTAET